jgi:hypothetical protein
MPAREPRALLPRGADTHLVKPTFLLLGLVPLTLPACAGDATRAALGLPYAQFDQTPHSGWRALADDQRLQEAAALIEAYLSSHQELDRFQRSNLHWHAAQALAMAGDTALALKHMPLARVDPEPPASPLRWNDYVAATEAFLERDRGKLIAARQRMARANPGDANLPIVDALITHFDEPYSRAYRVD